VVLSLLEIFIVNFFSQKVVAEDASGAIQEQPVMISFITY